MFTAPLLGLAVDDLIAVGFLVFIVAGTAAALFTQRSPIVEYEQNSDEADERLVTASDMLDVRAALDEVLVRKGLLTDDQLHLIRHGTKSRGTVTGMRATGTSREDHREVVLDVVVRKPGGGQFPAHETALIPASSLAKVSPGSIIDAYYRSGDESAVAVCVAPS